MTAVSNFGSFGLVSSKFENTICMKFPLEPGSLALITIAVFTGGCASGSSNPIPAWYASHGSAMVLLVL